MNRRLTVVVLFVFSSRRRHTRFDCDWSSDVCSSDLRCTSTITVTAKDANGNPIGGATVVLAATGSGNTLTQPSGTTDATGVATGTLSATVAGPKTVSATVDGAALTQTTAVARGRGGEFAGPPA